MAQPANRLVTLAHATLDAVVAGFAAAAVPLPGRQFVAPGTSAALPFDCEFLAVNLERTFGHEGNVAGETVQPILAHPGFALRGAGLVITLVRCTPTVAGGVELSGRVKVPSLIAETAAADALLTDGMVLTNAILDGARNGGALGTCCNGAAVEGWRAIGPAGGFGGSILTIRLNLA